MSKGKGKQGKSRRPHQQGDGRPSPSGVHIGSTPLFQSPMTDLRHIWLNAKYTTRRRDWWVWVGGCIILLVLSVEPGGFLAGLLLRIALFGGIARMAAETHRRRDELWPVSIGCFVPLIALLVVGGLVVGGSVMKIFGAA